MKVKKYTRLNFQERVIIETLLKENRSKTFIAKRLKRSKSSIGNEVNKWVITPNDIYDAKLADWVAKDNYHNKRNLVERSLNTISNNFNFIHFIFPTKNYRIAVYFINALINSFL